MSCRDAAAAPVPSAVTVNTVLDTSATSSSSSPVSSAGEHEKRKRGRSPPGPPFMLDYRPYSSGLLQLRRRRPTAEIHKKQWDLYYRNNTVNGYKDRHYILREFHELRAAIDAAVEADAGSHAAVAASFSWMEAGCGVGNAMLPIFEQYGHLPQWRALLGFDVSSVAIRLLEEKRSAMPPELAAKVHVCVLNPSESDVSNCVFFQLPPPSAAAAASSLPSSSLFSSSSPPSSSAPCLFPEFVSLIFVLCSIPVSSHAVVLRRIAACMSRPGGVLYFRDYAVSDHAESRFRLSHRQLRSAAGESDDAADDANTYERTNGTLSHFFSVEEVRQLFESAGFEAIALGIIESVVTNRKTNVSFARKFVQGRFRLLD
ncbi:Methyltransferase domain containing protein [Lotmaria passim]